MEKSSYDRLAAEISELVLCHSPSGWEDEIDRHLLEKLRPLGLTCWRDDAGNVVARIKGRDPNRTLAITAHKDEIAAIVKSVQPDGRVQVRKLGGSFPWIYGEGVVDLLGDRETVHGVLSFGSRHVSHESPQKCYQEDKAISWEAAWVDTKMIPDELSRAGIRPGTRMVIGKHRKKPFRLGDYLASYALDNKASCAILLDLAATIRNPSCDIVLVFSAREEVGAMGALYFTSRHRIDTLIALEIVPKSAEYPLTSDQLPALVSQDGYGLYDEKLNRELAEVATAASIPVQHVVLAGFGSDASLALKAGHVPRAACLGFPTDNTHGYEIAHLRAILQCRELLKAYCEVA